MKKIFLLLFSLASFSVSYSQVFGGNPPSTKWRQVNTDTLRVIFPAGLDSIAARVTTLANSINRLTTSSIGNRQKKVNILLQNTTTISNGYVALGPFRSEFELMPQQNSFELGSLPWPDNLAIHEWRHVQQYNNFNRGLSKAFFIVFGQEGQALANALSVPDWFFEGDAVYQETLVSEQGRGRLPFFFNGYRSLWEAKKNYSWMKLRNGSFRDYVPDHYRLGYMFVAYGREKYGQEFWKNVTQDASAFKGLFYPLQKGIKKATGKSYTQFTNEAMDFFKAKLEVGKGVAYNNQTVSGGKKQKHFIADEEYPYWMNGHTVVYMRTTYDRIPQFVVRKGDTARKLRARDISIDNYFSYRNGKIIYAAYQPDIRWGRINYSDLKLFNVKTGKQVTLTYHSRYFAPDISEDGKSIVAVSVDEKGRSELHLLDDQGKLTWRIPNTDQLFYTYPKFFPGGKILTAVRNRNGMMSLALVNITDGSNQFLLPFTYNVIGFPSSNDEGIYFSASSNGYDRLFQLKNGIVSTVPTSSIDPTSTGDYQLNVANGKMVWTRFTHQGHLLHWGSLPESGLNNPGEVSREASDFQITSLRQRENDLLQQVRDTPYPVSNYSKSFHLLNFHSRRPYINDPDYTFSFVSGNILNTLQAELFVGYNRNEGYTQFGASAIYGQFFPVFKLSSAYTINRNIWPVNRSQPVYWDEWESSLGISFPLNLTKGRTFTSLSFASDLVYNQRYFKGYYKDSFDNRSFAYLNNSISFTNQIQQARKHIFPRFAQTLTLNFKGAVTSLEARQFLASGSLYLPGLFRTHNLVLQGAYQGRDSLRNVIYSNSFPFSRGYQAASFFRMWKAGGNYHLPLVYPDWGFANIVYFLRIRANVFYDFTRAQDFNASGQLRTRDFRSFGQEVYFDTKWWNQLPISIGIRHSYLFDPDIEGRTPDQWEIVLPVNLLSQY